MTVAELEKRMTTDEFAEWRAFERLEPFGSPAAHWRSALIATMLANIHRDPKKSKAFKLADFLPDTALHRRAAGQELSARMMSHFQSQPKATD